MIAMTPPQGKPILPKPEVSAEENLLKVEVVEELLKKKSKNFKLKIYGFNDDEDVKDFDCELKTDSECVDDLKTCDLDYELILKMIIKTSIKFSMLDKEVILIAIENLVVVDKECTTRCFRVDVKRKSTEDKVHREKVFEVDEALDSENSMASSFQVRGNDVDKIQDLKT
ncbi:hypothetical protein Tco_1066318 [Tanacetum coccineum]|uniref:Uncharacterized protein n=1 Tax=Tanacetum coccineum TaxID=301880 RepID=A0ABQ5H9Q2_9ASTR